MPKLVSLTARPLLRLARTRFDRFVLAEIRRARERIAELEADHPTAGRDQLARKLVASRKSLAVKSGAVTGLFGIASVPLDLLYVAYLQLTLMIDIAVLSRVNLKSIRAQEELLDLLGYVNGAGPIGQAGPRLLGGIAVSIVQRGGLRWLGRSVPVVAAPVSAWLNSRAISRAGAEALRFYAREEQRQWAEG